MPAEIVALPVLSDNYAVLVHDSATGATAAIDAPAAEPILAALAERNWRLTDILVTHHHQDHIEGIPALVAAHGARVVASREDAEAGRVPGVGLAVAEGDEFRVGSILFEVIETPGHCAGHVSYWAPDESVVFVGDTLFSLGCGRVFGADPTVLWRSLKKLRALPGHTDVWCGHEYTASNARFALTIEPDNAILVARAREVEAQRAAGRPTLPTTIAAEMRANPFLRCDEPSVAAAVGLSGADPGAVFTEVRARKNTFRG